MTVFLLQDLPMFWKGRAKALRILDGQAARSDPITLETARVYEECATELLASLAVPADGIAQLAALAQIAEIATSSPDGDPQYAKLDRIAAIAKATVQP